MQIGDRVTWQFRPSGGYGYVVPVAAVVRSISGRTVVVDVARKVGGRWQVETRRVRVASLTARSVIVPELDGEGAKT